MSDFLIELDDKMTIRDGKRIWKAFQRYAEYSDLKELYQLCIPEISKFEERLIDFQMKLD